MVGGDTEKGFLVYDLTGGYPPAVRQMARLRNADLMAGLNPEKDPKTAIIIATELRRILDEYGVWKLINSNQGEIPEGAQLENPQLVIRKVLHLLAMSDNPMNALEFRTPLGLSDLKTFHIFRRLPGLVRWADKSNVKPAGYVLEEPIKTILRNIFNIYGNQHVIERLAEENPTARKLPKGPRGRRRLGR